MKWFVTTHYYAHSFHNLRVGYHMLISYANPKLFMVNVKYLKLFEKYHMLWFYVSPRLFLIILKYPPYVILKYCTLHYLNYFMLGFLDYCRLFSIIWRIFHFGYFRLSYLQLFSTILNYSTLRCFQKICIELFWLF